LYVEKRALGFLITAALFAGGAPAAQRGALPPRVDDPHTAYELQGLTVRPPQGRDWFVFRRDREAVFFGKKVTSPTHAFAASVVTQLVDRTFANPEEFLEFIKQAHAAGINPARETVIENDAALDGTFARYCVRYHVKAEDRGAPGAQSGPLTMVNYGVTCLHPHIPNLLVDVGYSERGRASELDPELRAEGNSLVQSLSFTELKP
jgi:hypothetical protein